MCRVVIAGTAVFPSHRDHLAGTKSSAVKDNLTFPQATDERNRRQRAIPIDLSELLINVLSLSLQIAMKNGVIQQWGLVEFKTSEEAETTRERIDGHEIAAGHRLRVQFCIPGVHAINIYMSFVNNPMDTMAERKALMEDSPSVKVGAKRRQKHLNALENVEATC